MPRTTHSRRSSATYTIHCAVCARGLSNAASVARGTGPVCAKHVKRYISEWRNSPQSQNMFITWHRTSTMNQVGMQMERMAITAARSQFLSRLHRHGAVSTSNGLMENQDSRTRRQLEDISYENFQNATIIAHSQSGRDYILATNSTGDVALDCSCPDRQHSHDSAHVCRHMAGYNRLADVSEGQNETIRHDEAPGVAESNRVSQIPTIIIRNASSEDAWETNRDRNILIWQEQHKHDGIFVSENDEAWKDLKLEAAVDYGEYETENALDGIDNTFGIELETEGGDYEKIGRELYRAGLSDRSMMISYNSRNTEGMWTLKHDGSLSRGGEVISPILKDTPETWAAIQEVTKILNSNNATTSRRTGFHIHIGNQVLDDRGYRWQRLGRYMIGYDRQFNTMGAASNTHGITPHRQGSFTGPLSISDVQKIKRTDTAIQASKKIIGYRHHDDRYKMINTAKMIESGVPTVEFRYPNGTVDKRVVQRQVQLANATMMQAAFLRKDMLGANRLPHVFNTDPENIPLSSDPETRFRQFLDTLGSHRLRLNATRLWIHGSYY